MIEYLLPKEAIIAIQDVQNREVIEIHDTRMTFVR